MICVFCLFTRVYIQYFCICLQQYWRLVLQFIFNNFVIWCKIFATENLFFNAITKKYNHLPHQSLTANNNSPSSPAMGLEPTTSGLPAQCLIHSSTRSLIEKHENLSILTHIRLLQFDTRYLQLDTKYLQLKIYFSIQIQNICNGKSIFQFRYKTIANLL